MFMIQAYLDYSLTKNEFTPLNIFCLSSQVKFRSTKQFCDQTQTEKKPTKPETHPPYPTHTRIYPNQKPNQKMLFKTFACAVISAATLAKNCSAIRAAQFSKQRDPTLFAELASSSYNNFDEMPSQLREDLLSQLYAELEVLDDSEMALTQLTNASCVKSEGKQENCYPPETDEEESCCNSQQSCCENGPEDCCLAQQESFDEDQEEFEWETGSDDS